MATEQDKLPITLVDEAVRAAYQQLEGGLITGWVMVCTYDSGGEDRGLLVEHSEDLPPWTQSGMLYEALHMEQDVRDDEDDDD